MQNYFAAKCKLFTEYALKNAVINIDDEYGCSLLNILPANIKVLTYSLQNPRADLFWQNGVVHTPWGKGTLATKLMGKFNQSNTLASLAACLLQEIDFEHVMLAANKLQPAAGRMELVHAPGKQQPVIVVDYAHTPDALTKALQTLREYKPARLFCVFGCGGDRDRSKRPLMLQAVIDNCDEIVITQDNPRTEDAQRIVQDMLQGQKIGSNITIELDRKLAIHNTVLRATDKDIVLIAGKGHENYQIIGTTKFPFSDQLVARNALGES